MTRHDIVSQSALVSLLLTLAAVPLQAQTTPTERAAAAPVLAEIDRLLAAAGTNKANLISASIWLANMDTFAEMNSVWDTWVTPGATPARATVEARLAGPEYLVEIAVIAAVGA